MYLVSKTSQKEHWTLFSSAAISPVTEKKAKIYTHGIFNFYMYHRIRIIKGGEKAEVAEEVSKDMGMENL